MLMLSERLAVVARIWDRVTRADISLISAGVAFFGFLALFPAIAAVISIWGFMFDPSVIRSQVELTRDYLPSEAYNLVMGQVGRILRTSDTRFGLTTTISTLLALWSARAGVSALIDGLNAIHGLRGRLGHWHILRALMMTLFLVAIVLCAMALTVISPLVIGILPLGPRAALVLEAVNFGLGVLLVTAGIMVFYRLGPNRPKGGKRPPLFTWGLLIAMLLWAAASRSLVYYLATFNNYSQLYGSIVAVVALMLWFYLSAFVVLLGAAVDAERHGSPTHAPPPDGQ